MQINLHEWSFFPHAIVCDKLIDGACNSMRLQHVLSLEPLIIKLFRNMLQILIYEPEKMNTIALILDTIYVHLPTAWKKYNSFYQVSFCYSVPWLN